MSKNEIALDIDGTLVDSWPCIQYGFIHNENITLQRHDAYSDNTHGLSQEQIHKLCCEYVFKYKEHTCKMPYAQQCLDIIEECSDRIVLVTARDKSRNNETMDMMCSLYGDKHYAIYNKEWYEKPEWCVKTGIHALVDDHPKTVQLVMDKFKREELVCFMPLHAYNKHINTPLCIDTLEPIKILLSIAKVFSG